MIPWWSTTFGEPEISRIAESIRGNFVSQGLITQRFEEALAEFLGVKYVVAVSNGSSALLCALIAAGVGPDDEVIIPNRTWVATAHAIKLLGARPVCVDVERDRPLMDHTIVEGLITPRTKALIPVHMNGRAVNMDAVSEIARRRGLVLIEDAAQALGSRNRHGYLGTQGDMGCFSLSVAKTISTGQGGFVVTNSCDRAEHLRSIRTHGLGNTKDPGSWVQLGFNFRFTDVLASIGIEQLKLLETRIEHLKALYRTYDEGLRNTPFEIIPVRLDDGEVPLYIEFLVKDRGDWICKLASKGIDTRPFYPDIDSAKYLGAVGHFANSRAFWNLGLYLPSGPALSLENVSFVIDIIRKVRDES